MGWIESLAGLLSTTENEALHVANDIRSSIGLDTVAVPADQPPRNTAADPITAAVDAAVGKVVADLRALVNHDRSPEAPDRSTAGTGAPGAPPPSLATGVGVGLNPPAS